MRQTQRPDQKLALKLKQFQVQVGVLYETPVTLDVIDDEKKDEEEYQEKLIDEQTAERQDYGNDESPEYDDNSGELDYEPEEESEETPVDFKNFPVAEINIFEGELIVSINSRKKNGRSELLLKAIKLIIEKNKDFILRKTEKRNELVQKNLASEDAKDKSAVSRALQNNYLTLPDGISYCLGHFFSSGSGRKQHEIEEKLVFFKGIIEKEKERVISKGPDLQVDDLWSDSKITEEYNDLFEERDRMTILRLRKKFGIGSIDERYQQYLSIHKI